MMLLTLNVLSVCNHFSDTTTFSYFRHGGCWGDGDIRKLAYFEASVDPAYASGKVVSLTFMNYPPNLRFTPPSILGF